MEASEPDVGGTSAVEPTAPKQPRHRARSITAVALLVLAALLLPIAATALWAKRTVLNTERFTTTVSDVALDPEVTDAIATKITSEVFSLVRTSSAVQNLPSVLDPIRPIIAGALENRVRAAVENVISSDTFGRVFKLAVADAHRRALRVLEGDGLTSMHAFTVDGSDITFNLRPLILGALVALQQDGVIPSSIKLPGPDDPPGALASALGIEVPEDFGQVVVYSSDSDDLGQTLSTAQRILALAQRASIALAILALAVAAGAIAVAVDRRKAIFRLGVAITIISIILIIAVRRTAEAVPEFTTTPGARAIADALAVTVRKSVNRVYIILAAIGIVAAIVARYGTRIASWAGGHAEIANIVVVSVAVGLLFVLGFSLGAVVLALIVAVLGLIGVEYAKRQVEAPPLATGAAV